MEHKQIAPNWLLMGTAIFAFVAMAGLPHGCYRLFRWIACAVAIASAIRLQRTNHQGWVWVLGAVAILFKPLVPVHFAKDTWRIFDGAAGAAFPGLLHHARKDRGTGILAARYQPAIGDLSKDSW